ncbi:hypothetical protein H4582DRAFT_2063241 [Lactarius indigo]|nr:hypothetical protein H4582DRAFT_2063241 [Lactarius indigo]
MARADSMIALLSSAVGDSMQSQTEAKLASMSLKSPGLKSTMPDSPSARTFNTSTTNCHSLAFDSSSSFLSPDTANIVGNPSDAAATFAQQRVKFKATGNTTHRISVPVFTLSEHGTWADVLGQVAERDNSSTQDIRRPRSSHPQSTGFSGLSPGFAFCSPRSDGGGAPGNLDRPSPVVGYSWASMSTLRPLMNDLRCNSNVPHLDSLDKFRRPSEGHVHDSNSGSTAVNNGVYGDDGDLIQGHHAPGVGQFDVAFQEACTMMVAGLGLVLKARHSRIYQVVLAEATMETTRRLQHVNGKNPFGVNINMLGMANLSAMGWHHPEVQLFVAQPEVVATGGGFGQPGLGVGPGLGMFGGVQGGIGINGLRGGSGRSGGRSPGLGGSGSVSSKGGSVGKGRTKKDEEHLEPAVLNDVAGWPRTLRLHKYMLNFEGMTWKEMVVMDEQALEAQGVAALGARRKVLETFEVVRRKMGTDDPTAPPPVPSLSGGPVATGPGSSGSGGGLSSA